MTIRTKSAYSPIEPEHDGLRILATRLRGRGLPKTTYNVWMANLGPSEALLHAFKEKKISWDEFAKRYEEELFESSEAFDQANPQIKNHGQKFTLRLLQELAKRSPITLLCVCPEETKECHRHLLKKILEGVI